MVAHGVSLRVGLEPSGVCGAAGGLRHRPPDTSGRAPSGSAGEGAVVLTEGPHRLPRKFPDMHATPSPPLHGVKPEFAAADPLPGETFVRRSPDDAGGRERVALGREESERR